MPADHIGKIFNYMQITLSPPEFPITSAHYYPPPPSIPLPPGCVSPASVPQKTRHRSCPAAPPPRTRTFRANRIWPSAWPAAARGTFAAQACSVANVAAAPPPPPSPPGPIMPMNINTNDRWGHYFRCWLPSSGGGGVEGGDRGLIEAARVAWRGVNRSRFV